MPDPLSAPFSTSGDAGSVVDFYDRLANVFHLIHADWEASIKRQGSQLAAIIRSTWSATRILDAACGIGTQALGLASHGYRVVASDIAPHALSRARREARSRVLQIEFRLADLRSLTAVHEPSSFDVVLACDNSIPHLQTMAEIHQSFSEIYALLRPGGGCLISVRDYDAVERFGSHMHAFGIRNTQGGRVAVFQIWDFIDTRHYDLSMCLVQDIDSTPRVELYRTRYHAVLLGELEEALRLAGFIDIERLMESYFQPVLIASKPLHGGHASPGDAG